MHMLLTGGAGFIGSHLAERLLTEGHTVTVIDDLSTGRYANIASLCNNEKFTFVHRSISDHELMLNYCSACDVIVHMASSVGVKYIMENQTKSLDSNILHSIQLIKIASVLKKKLFFFSSSEIYGKSQEEKLNEQSPRITGESFRWSYSLGKAIGEKYCQAYGREYGLDYTIIRCFNIVGPRQVGNYGMVLPRFIDKALHNQTLTIYDDGAQVRTFTYVLDLVDILVKLVEKNVSQQVFNIGSANSISIKALAEKVCRLLGSSSSLESVPSKSVYGEDFEDIRIRIPDNTKLLACLGGYTFTSLDDIIQQLAQSKELSMHGVS